MTTGVKQNRAVTWTARLQRFHKHKFPTLRSYLAENNNRFKPDSTLFFPTPYTQIGIIWTIWSFRNDKFFDGVWEKSASKGWETRTPEPRKHSAVQFPTLLTLIVSSHTRNHKRERERGWDRKETKRRKTRTKSKFFCQEFGSRQGQPS